MLRFSVYNCPLLVHYRRLCGTSSPVSYSPAVWKEEHICEDCGHSSSGADFKGQGDAPSTMNDRQHDELMELFARNMQLSQNTPQPQTQLHPQDVMVEIPQEPEKRRDSPVIHYISSHYTATAHIRPDVTPVQPGSPPPSYQESLMPDAMADLLRVNRIDPSVLVPNQIHLFLNANDEQRQRLLELWQISPPSYPREQHHNKWRPTSVAYEENEARLRYEQQQAASRRPQEEHMVDTYCPEPISPIRGSGETAWPPAARMRVASITSQSRPQSHSDEVEPYMASGYQIEHQSRATDPVYSGSAGLWQAPSYAHFQQQDQIRNHADWERMNDRMAHEQFASIHSAMDDDMVM